MLRALAADAVFIAALFIEALASLSLLQSVRAVTLAGAFEPMLAYYHAKLAPALTVGANVFWRGGPQWYVDASVLGAILFFLFFIAQARKAMAPYDPAAEFTRVEAAVDWLLPALFCAAGAIALAPTLLPLLTIPAALLLWVGRFRCFELSRGYYLNLLCLAAISGGALFLQR